MAVVNSVPVHCTNQDCDYTGTIALVNETYFEGKKTCPKCGFKCLAFGNTIANSLMEKAIQEFKDKNKKGGF